MGFHSRNRQNGQGKEGDQRGSRRARVEGRSARGLYGDVVEELDWSAGQIVETLYRLKIHKRTLVIWCSDNGAIRRMKGSSKAPLTGRDYSTDEGGMRVPCLVRWPGVIKPGRESDHVSAFQDVMPTFAELAGAEAPADIDYTFDHVPEPDPRHAVRDVTHRVWDYEDDQPVVTADPPGTAIRNRLAELASTRYFTPRWWAEASRIAHDAGALIVVDAVHFAPHGRIDMAATDCDFLLASAYKFFGPHIGAMAGRAGLLEKFEAYRVRPAPAAGPGKWETGTQSFEALAGVTAAVDHIANLAPGSAPRRARLTQAYAAIQEHAVALGTRFLAGLPREATVFGITDDPTARTQTFAIELEGISARLALDNGTVNLERMSGRLGGGKSGVIAQLDPG